MRKLFLVPVVLCVSACAALAQSAGKGLVINEIYIGSFASSGTATDQYIELYNPQTTTQYLDGCILARFGNGGTVSNGVLQQVAEAWKFPGTRGGKTLAVLSKQFVVIAVTAKNWSGGVDLSEADYETYTGGMVPDEDNPNSTNLQKITAAQTVSDLQLSATMDAIILTNGSDANLADGITVTSVIDGVQYNTAWTAGNLPATIDAGFTGGPNLKYGYSMERNKKGVTTINSSTDFGLQFPTVGYEHGEAPQKKPLTVKDIFPFDQKRFVAYDEYDTVTEGATPNKGHASKTVFGSGISFQGQSSVAWVNDTSIATGVSDLHYLPTPSGDLKVFADEFFVSSVLPTTGLGITFNVPNQFVDYFKMSAGVNTVYPVATVTGVTTQSGVQVNFTVTTTGIYKGIERNISVPRGTFDTTYRFDLPAQVQISALGGLISGNFTATESFWIAKGIGIIKSNLPRAGTTISGNTIVVGGIEKEMIAYGIQGARDVLSDSSHQETVQFYPNPVDGEVNVRLGRSADRIELYSSGGRMIRSFDIIGRNPHALLWLKDLSDGPYIARVLYGDGRSASASLIVKH
jgi:hypothetical protein